jgi:hypothetical protein
VEGWKADPKSAFVGDGRFKGSQEVSEGEHSAQLQGAVRLLNEAHMVFWGSYSLDKSAPYDLQLGPATD